MLSAEASILSLEIASYESSVGPCPVSAEINVHDPDTTKNFERYITGEEKFLLYYICSSDLNQTLLLNVRRRMSTTELSVPSS